MGALQGAGTFFATKHLLTRLGRTLVAGQQLARPEEPDGLLEACRPHPCADAERHFAGERHAVSHPLLGRFPAQPGIEAAPSLSCIHCVLT